MTTKNLVDLNKLQAVQHRLLQASNMSDADLVGSAVLEIERLQKIEALARKISDDMATSMDWRELRELLA